MADNPLGKDMVTTKELAAHLKVHIATVNRWRIEEVIPATWNGRTYLFDPVDIKKLKEKFRKLSKPGKEKK